MKFFILAASLLTTITVWGETTYTSTSGYGSANFQCHINRSCRATKNTAKQRALYTASKQAANVCTNTYGGEYRPEVISNGITCHGWTSGTCAGYVSTRCIIKSAPANPTFSCDLSVEHTGDDQDYRHRKCQKLTICYDNLFESNLSRSQKEAQAKTLDLSADRYTCESFSDFRRE